MLLWLQCLSPRTNDCYLHGYDCIIMQLIVSSHAKSFDEKGLYRNVNDCFFVTTNFISTKLKIHFQSMNVKGRYCFSFDDFES